MSVLDRWLIGAVLVQVVLTIWLNVRLGRIRVREFGRRRTDRKAVALSSRAWSETSIKTSNALANQYESPVLFYVAAVLALALGGNSWVVVVLSWLFVALRIAHAIEHVGANNVRRRFVLFASALAVLCLIWAWLALVLLVFV